MLNEEPDQRARKWLFLLILLLLSIPQLIYRFKHPDQTETQLFFNFFNAYREFFYVR